MTIIMMLAVRRGLSIIIAFAVIVCWLISWACQPHDCQEAFNVCWIQDFR